MKKLYVYADGQILSQRIHDPEDPNYCTPYYYVHDRLGSVRLMLNNEGTAVNSYTYKPYGQFYEGESVETVDNLWKFTGQYYDAEIEQYYLRARQYDPQMMRFTGRDPEAIYFQEPVTINKFLYTFNNPVLYIDPAGEFISFLRSLFAGAERHNDAVNIATYGAEQGDWDAIIFGAALQETVSTAMLRAMADAGRPISADKALELGSRWVGKGYKEIARGVFRSADGKRKFRITESCIEGKHRGHSHVVYEYLEEGAKNWKKIHINFYD